MADLKIGRMDYLSGPSVIARVLTSGRESQKRRVREEYVLLEETLKSFNDAGCAD